MCIFRMYYDSQDLDGIISKLPMTVPRCKRTADSYLEITHKLFQHFREGVTLNNLEQ